MISINHSHFGINLNIDSPELPKEDREILQHAASVFGFIVEINKTISGRDWINKIKEVYAPSAKRDAIINLIEKYS